MISIVGIIETSRMSAILPMPDYLSLKVFSKYPGRMAVGSKTKFLFAAMQNFGETKNKAGCSW